jgi:hypothetical protein
VLVERVPDDHLLAEAHRLEMRDERQPPQQPPGGMSDKNTFRCDGTIVRQLIAGTGRYEGMEMSGTVTPLGPFPVLKPGTFQDCNRQTGTYELR